ncbi:hypothetical protein GCM10010433_69450 [Streptomyces pulveraceus]
MVRPSADMLQFIPRPDRVRTTAERPRRVLRDGAAGGTVAVDGAADGTLLASPGPRTSRSADPPKG